MEGDSIESLKDSSDSIEILVIFYGFASINELLRNARHESQSDSRNDGIGVDCHDLTALSLAMTNKRRFL